MALNLYVIDGGRYRDAILEHADVVAYWPLDEPDRVNSCHSAVVGVPPIVWTNAYEGRRAVAVDLLEYEHGGGTRAGARAPGSNFQDSGRAVLPSSAFAGGDGTFTVWARINKSVPFTNVLCGTWGRVAGDYGVTLIYREGVLRWELNNYPSGVTYVEVPDASVPDQEWFLFTATMEGGTAKVYVNGAQVLSSGLAWTPFGAHAQDLDVQVLSTNVPTDPEDGFGVFGWGMINAAMTAGEVADLYASRDIDRFLVNEYLDAESLRITDAFDARSTCEFTLQVRSNLVDPYRPLEGAEVVVMDTEATPGDERVFAGFIDDVDEDGVPAFDGDGTEELLTVSCSCVDYTEFVDRHIVIGDWDALVSGDVVEDLVASYLAADGVYAPDGFIEAGPVVSRVVAGWIPLGQVLDDLSTRTGMSWFIDYYRRFRWFAAGTAAAPFDVVDPVQNVHGIRRKRSRANYRNVQYVKGGTDTTDLRTESFKGDGSARTYVVAYPVKAVPTPPTVTVNGSAKTVGVKGVDTGRDWYYSDGATEVAQDDGAAPLTTSDVVAITYRGTFPVTVAAQLDDEIAERASREASSGRYEHVETAQNIDRSDMAAERAEGLLRRFGTVRDEGTIRTSSTIEPQCANLRAGQVQQVSVAQRGLAGDMLVSKVTISSAVGGHVLYEYDLVSEESSGTWADFFKRLAQQAAAVAPRDDETFVLLRNAADVVFVTEDFDDPTQASYAAAIVGTAIVGYSEVGS